MKIIYDSFISNFYIEGPGLVRLNPIFIPSFVKRRHKNCKSFDELEWNESKDRHSVCIENQISFNAKLWESVKTNSLTAVINCVRKGLGQHTTCQLTLSLSSFAIHNYTIYYGPSPILLKTPVLGFILTDPIPLESAL